MRQRVRTFLGVALCGIGCASACLCSASISALMACSCAVSSEHLFLETSTSSAQASLMSIHFLVHSLGYLSHQF